MSFLQVPCSIIGIKLLFLHTEASTARDASPEKVGHPQCTSAKGACYTTPLPYIPVFTAQARSRSPSPKVKGAVYVMASDAYRGPAPVRV